MKVLGKTEDGFIVQIGVPELQGYMNLYDTGLDAKFLQPGEEVHLGDMHNFLGRLIEAAQDLNSVHYKMEALLEKLPHLDWDEIAKRRFVKEVADGSA